MGFVFSDANFFINKTSQGRKSVRKKKVPFSANSALVIDSIWKNFVAIFWRSYYLVDVVHIIYSSNWITTKLGDRKLEFDWLDFINKQPKFWGFMNSKFIPEHD